MANDVTKRRGESGQYNSRYRLTSTVIAQIGNPMSLSSGRLILATNSSAIVGIARENKTGTGSNFLYIEEINPETEYEMVTNATITIDDVGVYFRLAVATNVFTVDKTAGAQTTTARQVVVTDFLSSTRCLVKFVKVAAFQDN
jgi:hypothetical protein